MQNASQRYHGACVFVITLLVLTGVLFYWYRDLGLVRNLHHSIKDSSKEYLSFDLPGTKTDKIRIICYAGSHGTNTDAEVYSRVFPNSYIVVVDEDQLDTHPDLKTHVPINLYIEHCIGVTEGYFPSDYRWLMVNQEFLVVDLAVLTTIDLFLCKSQYATTLVQNLILRNKLPGSVWLTRHTSEDLLAKAKLAGFAPDITKKEKLFVHFAGKSWLKHTETVLETWIRNKGFPQFGFPTLIVTCRGMCLSRNAETAQILSQFRQVPGTKSFVHPEFPNIIWYDELTDDDLLNYQLEAGAFIYPSVTEGYGHCINEARSARGLIITVDSPPMNELIDQNSGILVPVEKKVPSSRFTDHKLSLPGSLGTVITTDGLANAITRYFNMSQGEKNKMRERARKRYEEDRTFLITTLGQIKTTSGEN